MTPTQVQIEAAAKETERGGRMSNRLSEDERHAVAHAQYRVDRATPDHPDVCFDYELVASLLGLINRLIAAAEVGEPNPVLFLTKKLADKQRELDATIIERCAQVADRWHTQDGDHIAAAIRALRDS